MVALLNPLMGLIVLPYLGPAAAEKELTLPTPQIPPAPGARSISRGEPGNALAGLQMRVTRRTLLVLGAIAAQPGASNRQVAEHAGVSDQGQISKLLARLEGLGLIENLGGEQPSGAPNQWLLTPRGLQVQNAISTETARTQPSNTSNTH